MDHIFLKYLKFLKNINNIFPFYYKLTILGGINIKLGHNFLAMNPGIADLTPYFLAK